jgi:hypothetical protein
MGTAIIAGLTFATFLTLVIVPVMYSVFDSLSEKLSMVFSRSPQEDEAPAFATSGNGYAPASFNAPGTPRPAER